MFDSSVSLPLLVRTQPFKARRISSYDQTGSNADAWQIAAGETRTLAEMDEPGLVSYFWCTVASRDQHYLRKVVLKVYWDSEEQPSICSPICMTASRGANSSKAMITIPAVKSVSTGIIWSIPCRSPGISGSALNTAMPMTAATTTVQ